MKIYVFALLFVAAVAFARQLPVEDLNEDDILNLPVASEDESVEVKPVEEHRPELAITCDILGSTRACATHCILKGYRGGWCDAKSVCNCR
ncbi:U-Asilidin(12)-Dg3b-like [Temnothorax longispinosus]|uniref:U-Asilidin(12)-Dg3b-like n=1 Tax=Temnothorax longispinosus TaxID=300112 RepID=UPI003A99075E